jgi:hypothetical protein
VSFSTSQGANQPANRISQTDPKTKHTSLPFFSPFRSSTLLLSPFSFTLLFLLLLATKELNSWISPSQNLFLSSKDNHAICGFYKRRQNASKVD